MGPGRARPDPHRAAGRADHPAPTDPRRRAPAAGRRPRAGEGGDPGPDLWAARGSARAAGAAGPPAWRGLDPRRGGCRAGPATGSGGRDGIAIAAGLGRGVSGPDRLVRSTDGTPIAVFESGVAEPGTRPLVLVHGTTADHLTFRVVGPLLGRRRRLFSIDRRGRGASGDGVGTGVGYAIECEFKDVAAVAEALAAEHGGPVDVVGHSYGGRCALGASLVTPSIRRVVCYEGAPAPAGWPYQPDDLAARLGAHLDQGDPATALETFFREVVGFDDAAMADFRASPVWPLRVAAAHTIPRELDAERSPAASLDALGGVTVPVLQVLGTASKPAFHEATAALDARLVLGSVAHIEGAAHAAHHTHPDAFVLAVEAFLGRA
ncbi:MAG: alpha/beta hydrolase [Chloroflexota bacterium]|nr:MAG: alpha/beta hydrolase [Chloroflexota bacterium]